MAYEQRPSALGDFVLSAKDLGLGDTKAQHNRKETPDAGSVTQQAILAVAEMSGISADDIKRDLLLALKGHNISSAMRGEPAMRMLFGNSLRFIAEELASIDTRAMTYLGATFIHDALVRKNDQLAAGLADLLADPPVRQFTSDELRNAALAQETQQHKQLTRHVDMLTASIDLFATEHWGDQAAEYRSLLDQLCPPSAPSTRLRIKTNREEMLSQLRTLATSSGRQRRAAALVQ